MALTLPNGSAIAIGSTYGTTKAMSAVTNANPAVATLEASHGIIVNDIMHVVSSGWEGLEGRVVRASVVATNDITLEGVSTTNTTKYPTGSGVGTVREVTAWTNITQILNTASDGGEQNFYTYQFLESQDQRRVPTFRTPIGYTLTMADDQSLAWYTVLDAADEDRSARAIRITLASGAKLYFAGIITLNKIPTLTVNEAMAITATLSFAGQVQRYAS